MILNLMQPIKLIINNAELKSKCYGFCFSVLGHVGNPHLGLAYTRQYQLHLPPWAGSADEKCAQNMLFVN